VIEVYSATGTQAYSKICRTYTTAKKYVVSVTTSEKVTYLNLNGQNVNEFEAGTKGTNLIYLSLDDNAIESLSEGAFAGLTQLKELYLSNNNLAYLPSKIFNGLSNLQILELSWNNLLSLSEGIFNGLTKLEALDLSHNNL
jgi:Leucine-rich repeat (LRR) protein